MVNFRHLSPRKSFSGHFWIGSSDCRRAEKNCIVNSNHLNNMACLLLSLNMAPLFAASQLWHPLFSREGKGDLCFQLRSINWLPLLLLFLLLILAFFFFFHLMYDMGQQLGARAFRRANLCLFSVEVFPFLFRSWQILSVSASAIFSIGLTILLPFRHEKTTRGESVRQQIGGLFERLFGLISESGFLVSICGAVKHQVLNNSSYWALS